MYPDWSSAASQSSVGASYAPSQAVENQPRLNVIEENTLSDEFRKLRIFSPPEIPSLGTGERPLNPVIPYELQTVQDAILDSDLNLLAKSLLIIGQLYTHGSIRLQERDALKYQLLLVHGPLLDAFKSFLFTFELSPLLKDLRSLAGQPLPNLYVPLQSQSDTKARSSAPRHLSVGSSRSPLLPASEARGAVGSPVSSIHVTDAPFGLTDPGWNNLLSEEFAAPYFKEIQRYVASERASHPGQIYPPDEDVFSMLNLCPIDKVKVVILGQDPYFNPGQAHGLCFSVRKGVPVPPSLNRIYKVLKDSIPGFNIPKHGCLVEWAQQGVLMLNATYSPLHLVSTHS